VELQDDCECWIRRKVDESIWEMSRLNANICLIESSEIAGLRADMNPGFLNREN
jgi:hypothetical protein